MILFLRNISLVFLASFYLVASFGTMIHQITMPCISAGPQKIQASTGSSKDHPKPVLTQRRYMPMVKEGPATLLVQVRTHLHHDLKQFASVTFNDPLFYASAFYFSSLSDRAPPLS